MATAAVRIRAESLPLSRRAGAFLFLMVAEFFYGWSWNTVDVLRPQLRAELGLTLTEAGSAYSAQSAGALLGAVILGQVADRFGRRNTLFWIIVGYAVFGAAGTIVSSYPQLLVQRFLLGVSLGGIFPVLIGLYMGLFPSNQRGKLASLGNGTYNLSVIALGAALSWPVAQADWHVLLWACAIPPLLLAPLIFWVVPDDRTMTAWGAEGAPPPLARLPIVELFRPALRRLTILLFLLIGLNFFAYQAFAGWVTTYLQDVRGFTPAVAGGLIAWQFAGSTVGGFFWGWFSDRFGRKPAAAGFFGGALLVILYLTVLTEPAPIRLAGFFFGFMIASSVAWAPWMSELFPAHLRSTAMSIFNWGRLISFFSPLITGAIAENLGLQAAMLTAAAGFGLAGIVWLTLPETLKRAKAAA